MKYAQLILDRMNAMGMSKQELSGLSGIPYMTVSGILKNGAAKSGLQNVLAICRVLSIDPNVFSQMYREEDVDDMSWGLPILKAYAAAPVTTQGMICKMLDIKNIPSSTTRTDNGSENSTVRVYRAARSSEGAEGGAVNIPASRLDKLRSAKPAEDI